jgi:hypothetical protein
LVVARSRALLAKARSRAFCIAACTAELTALFVILTGSACAFAWSAEKPIATHIAVAASAFGNINGRRLQVLASSEYRNS